MTDPRVERLAALLLDYSLSLEAGQVVRLDGTVHAAPLVVALYRGALERGAHPYTSVTLDGLDQLLLDHGTDEQIAYLSPTDWAEVEAVDAIVTIWSEGNTRELSRVDPDRQARLLATRRRLGIRRWERIAAGELRWVGTLFPTHAHAQDAELPLGEYEAFVYRACHVEDAGEDATAHWRGVASALAARARTLDAVRTLRIVGRDTDLTLGVEGRRWLAADGIHNMPDGEVFTSPLETATEGEIRFRFPAVFNGREVEDVRLAFAGGRVVRAEARSGRDYLRALLDIDDGARVLGEVAFGLNDEIDRFTRNILFDEKIGGTIHVALGSSFPQAGGANVSGLHWDLICDLRDEGEVYADGELVWKAGGFLAAAGAEA